MPKNGLHGSKQTLTWKEDLAEDKRRKLCALEIVMKARSCVTM